MRLFLVEASILTLNLLFMLWSYIFNFKISIIYENLCLLKKKITNNVEDTDDALQHCMPLLLQIIDVTPSLK